MPSNADAFAKARCEEKRAELKRQADEARIFLQDVTGLPVDLDDPLFQHVITVLYTEKLAAEYATRSSLAVAVEMQRRVSNDLEAKIADGVGRLETACASLEKSVGDLSAKQDNWLDDARKSYVEERGETWSDIRKSVTTLCETFKKSMDERYDALAARIAVLHDDVRGCRTDRGTASKRLLAVATAVGIASSLITALLLRWLP